MSADAYRGLALVYDPATSLALDPLRRLVGDVLGRLGAGRILDVCCGTGRLVAGLRRQGLAAVGIDGSPAMLRVARRTVRDAQTPFARMDARRLGFADATFDAAVVMLALHENEEADRLALGREMVRVVRPGGHLLVLDYAAPAASGAMGRLVPLVERLAGPRHYRNYRDFLLRKGAADFVRRLGRSVLAAYPCLGGQASLVVAGGAPAGA